MGWLLETKVGYFSGVPAATTMAKSAGGGEPDEVAQIAAEEKIELGKWFLSLSPPDEISVVAEDLKIVLGDDSIFDIAASKAYPVYNRQYMVPLELPDGSGKVLVAEFGEIDAVHYLDPRTAQVATVDHVKQVCTALRPAADEELPSAFVEEYRAAVELELSKYVERAFPKGECAVYCTSGKDAESGEEDIQLTAVIRNSRFRADNFCSGCWLSIWKITLSQTTQSVELKGTIKVKAHYFEEGNVQLDTGNECSDSTTFQGSSETGTAIANIISHQESQFLTTLEDSFSNLSDSMFKELRRKLPITRTQFSWNHALQLSLSRDIAKGISGKKGTAS